MRESPIYCLELMVMHIVNVLNTNTCSRAKEVGLKQVEIIINLHYSSPHTATLRYNEVTTTSHENYLIHMLRLLFC